MKTETQLTFESTRKLVETKDYKIQINEAGKGHPIIMIHGGGAGATGWSNYAPNIAVLSKKFRCIAVTMPGWGESSAHAFPVSRHGVASLKQLIDALGIDRAAFVGNSMGGGVSAAFAVEHEARVSHLITMGIGGLPGMNVLQAGGLSEGLRILVQAYEDPSPHNMKRFAQIMCYDQSMATDELAQQRSDQARRFPEHLENFRESFGQPFPATDVPRLLALKVPTLVIHGRDDRVSHFEASLRAVAMIPNSRMVLINRCGHWVQLEHSAEFNRLVDEFVSNN